MVCEELTLIEENGSQPLIILSVSQVTTKVKNLLTKDKQLQDVWISGEVSGARPSQVGHLYFTIKDESSQLNCVLFGYKDRKGSEHIKDGAALMIHGKLDVYEPRGQYNFRIDAVLPTGTGNLFLEFLRRKQRLEQEGLFRPEIKRPIPTFPMVIGVVTSATGAAVQDILKVFQRRYPIATIIISPAVVQGTECPKSVIQALEYLKNISELDAVIVSRGGGSLEDLFGFNDEKVVQTIRSFPVPVISGIGHETDSTLTDFASDFQAATPTAAAESLAPDLRVVTKDLWGLLSRMARNLDHQVQTMQMELDRLSGGLTAAMDRMISDRKEMLFRQSEKLDALSPLSVLDWGYSVTLDSSGKVVRNVGNISIDDMVRIRFTKGELDVIVKDIHERGGIVNE